MNIKGQSTLENFEKILKVKNYSSNTISGYVLYVKEMILRFDKPAIQITSKEIREYLLNYQYSSISKQNTVYSALKLFAKYILNIKYIEKVFLDRPRGEKKLPKVIEKQFILDRLAKIQNLKHKAILTIAYSVGLRVSEVVNLKIKDIDSKRMLIAVNQAKGRKDRIVPLSQTVLELLREYYREYRPKEYLFNGQFSLQYSAGSCNEIVKKYLGRDYHFHMLRHSCFTAMLESGVDLRIIQKIAGHSSTKTTEIYTHVSSDLLNKVQTPI